MNFSTVKTISLKVLMGLTVASLVACSKDEGSKKPDPKNAPPGGVTPYEGKYKQYKMSRIYKGTWRPVVNCVSDDKKDETTLTFDLWEQTATLAGPSMDSQSFTHSELRGKRLGTTRSWEVHTFPWEVPGSQHAQLNLDIHGIGTAAWQTVEVPNAPCKWCYGMVKRFTCKENSIPFDQKFVEAACDGDTRFMKAFMAEKPDVKAYINQVGVLGETAMTCALKNGRTEVVNQLLNRLNSGLDLNAGNIDAESPLMVALKNNQPAFATELFKREDVELGRLNNQNQSFLFFLNYETEDISRLIRNVNPSDLFTLEDTSDTTPIGVMAQQMTNFERFKFNFLRIKEVTRVNLDQPAINGQTLIERSLDNTNVEPIRFFLSLNPKQKISALKKPSRMLLMAADACDFDFIKMVGERSDINFEIKNEAGNNAIDIIRLKGTACVNAEAITTFLANRGVTDSSDPVTPACRGDLAGFQAALSKRVPVYAKTAKIFECVWNQPRMLDVITRYPNTELDWDWSQIETYAMKAVQSKNAELVAIYLKKMKFPASSATSFVAKLKTAAQSSVLPLTEYFDVLVYYSATTPENLNVGEFNNLVFNLVLANDNVRVEKYVQMTNVRYWPSLDLTNHSAVNDAYLVEYRNLLQANQCTLRSSLSEPLLVFAIRNQKAAMVSVIMNEMNRQGVRPSSTRVNCAPVNSVATEITLLSPVNMLIKSCATELLATIPSSASLADGANIANRMIRTSPWDALVAAQKCSKEQVLAMAATVYSSFQPQVEGEITTKGPHFAAIKSFLVSKSLVTTPVVTGFLNLPGAYEAVAVRSANESASDFKREDGRVLGTEQRFLKATSNEPKSWTDYRTETSYLISFAGIGDVATIAMYNEPRKKGKCLVLPNEGVLVMKDRSLAIKEVMVCPTTLRFKFDPATSEKELPIREHVDGEFKYSTDGLNEAT